MYKRKTVDDTSLIWFIWFKSYYLYDLNTKMWMIPHWKYQYLRYFRSCLCKCLYFYICNVRINNIAIAANPTSSLSSIRGDHQSIISFTNHRSLSSLLPLFRTNITTANHNITASPPSLLLQSKYPIVATIWNWPHYSFLP